MTFCDYQKIRIHNRRHCNSNSTDHLSITGGNFKISERFHLQETKLCDSEEVTEMLHFLFMKLMCLNILMH